MTPVTTVKTSATKTKKSCHHERHMSGVALKIYNLFWRLSKKSETRTISITNSRIAELIGARCQGKRADYIARSKMALVRAGWLKFDGVSKSSATGTWQGGRYAVVSHEEWANRKSLLLDCSPCQPKPLTVSVAAVHPGGMSYRKRHLRSTEAHTAYDGATNKSATNRACVEAHTDLQHGSTHRACASQHTQSVDFESSVDIHTVDATAVMPPVAMNEMTISPDGTSTARTAKPSEEEANEGTRQRYETWLEEAQNGKHPGTFNGFLRAYQVFMDRIGKPARHFDPPLVQAESPMDTIEAAAATAI